MQFDSTDEYEDCLSNEFEDCLSEELEDCLNEELEDCLHDEAEDDTLSLSLSIELLGVLSNDCNVIVPLISLCLNSDENFLLCLGGIDE